MQQFRFKIYAAAATVILAFGLIVGYGVFTQGKVAQSETAPVTNTEETAAKAVVKAPYTWKVTRVIDGDTVEVDAKFFPVELGAIEIRIRGVDTPEKGSLAKCASEAALAAKATDFAKSTLLGKTIIASSVGQDKYGGRVVAVVTVDGKVYGDMLISQGLAKPYFGKTKQSWCN